MLCTALYTTVASQHSTFWQDQIEEESLNQDTCTHIVFMDAHVYLDTFRCGQSYSSTNLFHHYNNGNEFSATGSTSYDLCLHSAGGNFSLELTLPKHRTPSNIDNISGPASNTDRITGIFIIVESSKIGIRICINLQIPGWINNQTFVLCSKQISSNQLQSYFMRAPGTEYKPCKLTHTVGYTRTRLFVVKGGKSCILLSQGER